MADLIPALLLAFGLVAALRPEWVAAVDRRQKAAGTTRSPADVEMNETYYAIIRLAGVAFAVFGLVFFLRSL